MGDRLEDLGRDRVDLSFDQVGDLRRQDVESVADRAAVGRRAAPRAVERGRVQRPPLDLPAVVQLAAVQAADLARHGRRGEGVRELVVVVVAGHRRVSEHERPTMSSPFVVRDAKR